MRLALKLVAAFLLANIALAALYGYLSIKSEVRSFRTMVRDEADSLAPPLQTVLADAWRSGGESGLQQRIEQVQHVQTTELHVRWVWFDRTTGDQAAPAAPQAELTATAIERHEVIETFDSSGSPMLDVYWPVPLGVARRGGLEFAHPVAELSAAERQIIERMAWLIGGMVVISGLLTAWLGVSIVGRPLNRVIEQTRRIGAGDFATPLHLQSHDELAELSESLNQMCGQLAEFKTRIERETVAKVAAIEELRHSDRLKTVGRLAAGIAHELGTPLNVVSGRAGMILSGKLAADEIGASATAIKTEVDRMAKIIRQLLDFARASKPRRAAVDLRGLVRQSIDLLRPLADSRKVRLSLTDGAAATATVDADQMQQVLANLLVNAIQAMPDGGDVDVAIRHESRRLPNDSRDCRPCWCIAIRDHGVGIPQENLPHLFEPFFTTKDVGAGTGLGLSIAYGIVAEHGGWIEVQSEPAGGSCFTVCLPENAT
jgi:two-component system NtrC family sensor kinase